MAELKVTTPVEEKDEDHPGMKALLNDVEIPHNNIESGGDVVFAEKDPKGISKLKTILNIIVTKRVTCKLMSSLLIVWSIGTIVDVVFLSCAFIWLTKLLKRDAVLLLCCFISVLSHGLVLTFSFVAWSVAICYVKCVDRRRSGRLELDTWA